MGGGPVRYWPFFIATYETLFAHTDIPLCMWVVPFWQIYTISPHTYSCRAVRRVLAPTTSSLLYLLNKSSADLSLTLKDKSANTRSTATG